MSSKIAKAILDLSPTDWKGILTQGKLFLSHLYVETTLYPTPIIAEADFKPLVENADKAMVAAENGGDIEMANREEMCGKLLEAMGQKLIPYINGLWAGNRTNLEKSGAKVSALPSPVPPPDQPVIKKIVRGPEAGSVKIYLVRGVNSSLKKRSRTEYRIFMFEKEEDTKGIEIGDTTNSTKLIGYDVPESVYRYFSVRAKNTGGSSLLASKVRFFLSS
jgi:hypothetical protein